jgi:quercetin dioxygenase-like cupin family protein
VVQTEALEVVSIPEYAGRLSEPFTMIDLVQIDDLTLSIYLCQGTMPRHRHLDQDELFLVYTGTISLESEWGTAILRPGELAVAPKGVAHRSSSLLHSLVLLLQPRLMVNRRNGDRRLFALKGEGRLEKVSLPAIGRQIASAFQPILLAHLDTFDFNLTLCHGTGPWCKDARQDSLVFCHDGHVTLDVGNEQIELDKGDLIVVPKGLAHRISSSERSLVVGVSRHRPPA